MAPLFFQILLLAVVLYALWRGGRDERAVSIICVVGTLVTGLVLSPLTQRLASIETNVMIVDLVVWAAFVAVALRSERFWPLWVAGLQLTALLGHLFKWLDSQMIPQAYGAALYFWSYPIVAIFAIGTWRSHQRRQRRLAPS